ncbi:hypothetical protein AAG906_025745 [Vitis piasezkii]
MPKLPMLDLEACPEAHLSNNSKTLLKLFKETICSNDASLLKRFIKKDRIYDFLVGLNISAEKMVNQTCPEPLIRIPYGARTAKSLDILEKSAGRFMEGHNSGRIIETGSRKVKELEDIGKLGEREFYLRREKLTLEAYTNIDHAGSMVDKRSVSGYCMYLGGNLVTWRFWYMALGICELLWLKIILEDLKITWETPMSLYGDNKCAINIANNPLQHDHTKHMRLIDTS